MKATNIKWDTDGDLILFQELPKTIEIPKDVTKDQISDYLSDQTGFCHFGYELIDDEPSQDGKHTHMERQSGCPDLTSKW